MLAAQLERLLCRGRGRRLWSRFMLLTPCTFHQILVLLVGQGRVWNCERDHLARVPNECGNGRLRGSGKCDSLTVADHYVHPRPGYRLRQVPPLLSRPAVEPLLRVAGGVVVLDEPAPSAFLFASVPVSVWLTIEVHLPLSENGGVVYPVCRVDGQALRLCLRFAEDVVVQVVEAAHALYVSLSCREAEGTDESFGYRAFRPRSQYIFLPWLFHDAARVQLLEELLQILVPLLIVLDAPLAWAEVRVAFRVAWHLQLEEIVPHGMVHLDDGHVEAISRASGER